MAYYCNKCRCNHGTQELCPKTDEPGLTVKDVEIRGVNTLDRQVGGDHYKKMKFQPWEVIAGNNYDFFEGSVLSYVMRWKEKGGVQDLDKTIHYLEHMKELAKQGHYGEVKQ